ncbi:MAG: methyltransferase [Kiritimatiellaeota bacterium]|nr:methyltransferase [Kiritimatiellota bacterium]
MNDEIKKHFPFACKAEMPKAGEFLSKSTQKYDLWFWDNNTFVLENPMNTNGDLVFPPHPESIYLANLIPFAMPNGKFLDVGIGSGILSITAAQRGWKTVGVDINEKALRIAKINAMLNEAQCDFIKDDLAQEQEKNYFDFCIANLPFEPTPTGEKNFLHSDGGEYGDSLIHKFIPIAHTLLKPNGVVVLPCFSLMRDNRSRFEEYLENLEDFNFISAIIRLSIPLDISPLCHRFKNHSEVCSKFKKEGYNNFVVEMGLLKKTEDNRRFLGVMAKILADKSWLSPSGITVFKSCD